MGTVVTGSTESPGTLSTTKEDLCIEEHKGG